MSRTFVMCFEEKLSGTFDCLMRDVLAGLVRA